jgi:hypothetical protein
MSEPVHAGGRLRAYLQFLVAILYFFLARMLARHGALELVDEAWFPLVEQAMLVLLLVVGYAAMGLWLDRQTRPLSEQGLPLRAGWPREFGLGLATGWLAALVCVLPLAVVGGIATSFTFQRSAFGWLIADAALFAFAALAEEIVFRGYAFQCLMRATGPKFSTAFFAIIYAALQALTPGSNHASFAVSFVFGVLLSIAYLRTRALWVSWGLNFGWKASRALAFGLAISGMNNHSPIVQGDPMGPFWLTGGGYGLDGSWLAFLVLLAALPVLSRITSELDFRYNAPVIVPAGIPVDLGGSSSSPLVQIAPAGQGTEAREPKAEE